MRKLCMLAAALAVTVSLNANQAAQNPDADRKLAGGGIMAPGWKGQIDAGAAKAGGKIEDSKFALAAGKFTIATGPAAVYWNDGNTGTGDYTVKATFLEPKFRNIMDHPHPYGIFIAGSGLGTDTQKLLYCAAYGSGTFIVRGFNPAPFALNGRRGGPHAAINKAAAVGEPVTQEIMWAVKGGTAECSINGQVVGTYDAAALQTGGNIGSLNGIYGIRVAHNVEVEVSGLEKK